MGKTKKEIKNKKTYIEQINVIVGRVARDAYLLGYSNGKAGVEKLFTSKGLKEAIK